MLGRYIFLVLAWLNTVGVFLGLFFPDVLPLMGVYKKLSNESFGLMLFAYLLPITILTTYVIVFSKPLSLSASSVFIGSLATVGVILTYEVHPSLGLGLFGLCACLSNRAENDSNESTS